MAIGETAGAPDSAIVSPRFAYEFEDGIAAANLLLAMAMGWLFGLRRDVVSAIVGSGVIGVIAAIAGAPVGG